MTERAFKALTYDPDQLPATRAAGQYFKGRLQRGRAIVDRLIRPAAYCRVCGDPLPPRQFGRSCDDCSTWARVIINAHESRRVRALFADCD